MCSVLFQSKHSWGSLAFFIVTLCLCKNLILLKIDLPITKKKQMLYILKIMTKIRKSTHIDSHFQKNHSTDSGKHHSGSLQHLDDIHTFLYEYHKLVIWNQSHCNYRAGKVLLHYHTLPEIKKVCLDRSCEFVKTRYFGGGMTNIIVPQFLSIYYYKIPILKKINKKGTKRYIHNL